MFNEYNQKFLKGKNVILRKMTKEDQDDFVKIEDVMKSRLQMNDGIPFPPVMKDHEDFLNSVSSDKDEYLFAIELKESKIFIGTIAVYLVNWKNGTCHVGISIAPSYQSSGYGTDAMTVLIDFIFNYMNVNKVKLQVFSFNEKAIKSYEKVGFKTEGILREELFRFGKFHDVYVMGILRKEWKTAKSEMD